MDATSVSTQVSTACKFITRADRNLHFGFMTRATDAIGVDADADVFIGSTHTAVDANGKELDH
jgi:hypothetical protein